MTQNIKEVDTQIVDKEELCSFTGSKSKGFRETLIRELSHSLESSHLTPNEAKDLADSFMDTMEGSRPRNELEAMLIAQAIATHSAAMECFRKAAHPSCSAELQQKSLGFANKLVRTYAVLLESLDRGRGKGGHEQRITVQHIHINDKAQAIVGDVARG